MRARKKITVIFLQPSTVTQNRPQGLNPVSIRSIGLPRSHCADLISACAIRNDGPRHWIGRTYDQRVTAVTRKKAEEYRRLAQQCLAMACTLSNAEARVSALQMAQVWQRLADEQERNPGLAESPPPPPGGGQLQPIVQQQQQVQPKDDDTKE